MILDTITSVQQQSADVGLIWAAIITAIGATIGGVALIIVKRVRPAVGVTDMWNQINTQNVQIGEQNRTIVELQRAVNELQEESITFRQGQQSLGEGFDALYGYVMRTTASGEVPAFTKDEARRINKARALREAIISSQPEMYI